jgi:hypothetical protein
MHDDGSMKWRARQGKRIEASSSLWYRYANDMSYPTGGAQRRSLPLSLRRTPGRPKGGALTSSRAVHVRGEASRTPRAPCHA